MFIVQSYPLAVVLCVLTMFCWGSWANTRKLAPARIGASSLFYWDYAIGVVLLIHCCSGLTLGRSTGGAGLVRRRSRTGHRLQHRSCAVRRGGIQPGQHPAGGGDRGRGHGGRVPGGDRARAALGVIVNYVAVPVGNPALLGAGVVLVTLAIVLDALAYRRQAASAARLSAKGLLLSLACGVFMGVFYRFVAAAMYADPPIRARPDGQLRGGLRVRGRGIRQQFPLEHDCHAIAGHGPPGAVRRLLARSASAPT